MRSIGLFLAVYVLGLFDVATFIPYVTAVLVVFADAARTVARGRAFTRDVYPRS